MKGNTPGLWILALAVVSASVYVYCQYPQAKSFTSTGAIDSLAKAIAHDRKKEFAKATDSLESYFKSQGALLPPQEVARIRYFRSTVDGPDYFDMLVCTRDASVWPDLRKPIKVNIASFAQFGSKADAVIHEQIASALKEWQEAAAGNVQFKLVSDPEEANINIVPEADPSFMPLRGAIADTTWIEDSTLSKNTILPKRQSATIRIIDPQLSEHPSTQQILAVRAAILHEFGHALGISGHSPNAADTMFAIENASIQSIEASAGLLSERDKATIQKLYEPSPDTRAAQRIEALAAAGNPYACHTLGIMYFKGEGKKKDDKEASKWFEQAASQNLAEGLAMVAEMNFTGRGRPKNYQKALELYKKAADLTSPDACINLGFMYSNGLGVEKDYAKARTWYQLGSERGQATATFNLGILYENGSGTDKDYAKAMEYYKRAASQGSPLALSAMSAMYYTGRGVKLDYVKGMELARRSAEQSADGKAKVGDLYFYGLGVPIDYQKALQWYEKGAKEGSGNAMMRIAGMHMWGRGAKRDVEKAKSYYKQAEEQGLDSAKQAQSSLDLDDAVGRLMQGQFNEAALALDRFLNKARKSYYDELERNFFYAAAYENIAWRHAGHPEKAAKMSKLILNERKSVEWPRDGVRYLLGELSEKELLKIAGSDNEKLTEGNYFIGANLALNKNYKAAREALERVLKEGRRDFFEYAFAEEELRLLTKKAPAQVKI